MSRKRNWWENNEFMEWSDNHPMLGSEAIDDEVIDKSPGAGKNSSGGVYIAQDYSKNPYDTTNKDISTKFFVYKDENSVIGGDEAHQVTVLNGKSKRRYNDSRDHRGRFTIQNNKNGYNDKDHEVPIGPDGNSNKSKTLEEWLRLNRQQQTKNSSESSGQSGNSSSGSGCDCDKKKEEEKKTGQQIGEKAAQAGNTASAGGASASGASSTSSGGTGSSTSGANSQGEDGCDCSGGGSGSGGSDSVKTSEVIENPFATFSSRLESVLDSRRHRGSGLIASTGKFDGLEASMEDMLYVDEEESEYIEDQPITREDLPKERIQDPHSKWGGIYPAGKLFLNESHQLQAHAFAYGRQSQIKDRNRSIGAVTYFDLDDFNTVVITYYRHDVYLAYANEAVEKTQYIARYTVFRADRVSYNAIFAPTELDEKTFFSYRLPGSEDNAPDSYKKRSETAIFCMPIRDMPVPGIGSSQKVGKQIMLNGTKVSKTYIAQSISKYGIRSYESLRNIVKGSGLQRHHLIERRFAERLSLDPKKMLSIVLSPKEHIKFTTLWRLEIGYRNERKAFTTLTVTEDDIVKAARRIYKDYPQILRALKI